MGIPEMGLHLRDHPQDYGGLQLVGQPPSLMGLLPFSSDAVHASYQDPAAARVRRVFRKQGNRLPPGVPNPLSPRARAQLVGCG